MKRDLAYYRKIFSDVEKKDFANLYLLEGSETFIMEELGTKIAAAAVPGDLRAFNLTIAHGGEMDIDGFMATAVSFPFLSEHRVLMIRELEKLRGSWKKLVAYCENPVPSSIVLMLFNPFDEGQARARAPRELKALEAAVKKNGRVIACDGLSSADVRIWVRDKGKGLGIRLDAEAVEVLIRSIGDNLFDLLNEITKLSLLFGGERVSAKDLAASIGSYRLDALFELIDRIEPGTEGHALGMVRRIIQTGAERPSVILYHLTRHFLMLLRNKTGSGGDGWIPDSVRRKASVFTVREIIVWLENLRRAELILKTSSFPEEALLVGVFAHAQRGSCIDYPVAYA